METDWTKVFRDMLDVMDFQLDYSEEEKFHLVDLQNAYFGGICSYENFENWSAAAIVERLDMYLNDYYFNDLEEEFKNYNLNDKYIIMPETAEEWINFLEENQNFKENHKHEYDVMYLISHIDLLNKINLYDVVDK